MEIIRGGIQRVGRIGLILAAVALAGVGRPVWADSDRGQASQRDLRADLLFGSGAETLLPPTAGEPAEEKVAGGDLGAGGALLPGLDPQLDTGGALSGNFASATSGSSLGGVVVAPGSTGGGTVSSGGGTGSSGNSGGNAGGGNAGGNSGGNAGGGNAGGNSGGNAGGGNAGGNSGGNAGGNSGGNAGGGNAGGNSGGNAGGGNAGGGNAGGGH
ncbi:MAG: hypothetical protein HYZ93_01920 [Candidatus Omnitrophica bacterium]|nr:hypothetical protein [Candidatus Omnitrophota bacterium]